MSLNDDVELYHNGEESFYYSFEKEAFYTKTLNTQEYRKQASMMVVPISTTLAVGLLAIVFNRWYMSVGNNRLNIVLFLSFLLVTVVILNLLIKKINKKSDDSDNFYQVLNNAKDIKEWLRHAEDLYRKLRNLLIISLLISLISSFLFLKYSIIAGLPLAIGGFVLAFLLIRYVNLVRRHQVLKEYLKN